jgi:hypothetical protein
MSRPKTKQQIRCGGCGKPILEGEPTARIALGKMQDGVFVEKKEYALLHLSPCFNRAIDSPAAVLDEVKRQSAAAQKAGG